MEASSSRLWSVPRLWDGESCFVVCGGESVRDLDLSRLANRRVIVVNSSYERLPNADFLVFSDKRWWKNKEGTGHSEAVRRLFTGQVVTVTPMLPCPDRYRLLGRARMSGLTPDPRHLAVFHTTTCPAINLAVHLGSPVINVLGLDGRGGWHHEPHKFSVNPRKFYYHAIALEALLEPLARMGVQVYNAFQDSAHKMFPHRSYEEMLA